MLGETYELVTEHYRYIAEQVRHHPPVSAYHIEGNDYKISGIYNCKSKFGLGSGTGKL